MSSLYTSCDMGLFDFFRSRSSSLSLRRSSTASSSTAAAPPASAGHINEHATPTSKVSPPKSAPPPSFTSLESMTSTTSMDSSNNEDEPAEPLGSIQNYDIIKELGRGATAVVQLGRQKDGDQLVALKVFKTSLLKKMREVKRVGRKMVVSTALDKVQIEIAIMKKLNHSNLLNLLEVFDDDSDTLVLMLEYAPYGQIMQWDATAKVYRANSQLQFSNNNNCVTGNGCLEEEELKKCVRQLLLGLEYLHENNICHRDLKPENILVAHDGVYKIADFGVAHLFEETDDATKNSGNQLEDMAIKKKRGYVSTTAGTYAFMGPETLKGGAFDAYAADVWALGITIHALAFGKIPFYHMDVVELFEQIETQPIVLENLGNNVDEGLVELLYAMLEKDPEKRWSLQQCKEHPWVLEGMDETARHEYIHVSHKKVTVNSEEVANAVTRVTSLDVLLRVKFGASKWRKRAQKTMSERKRSTVTDTSSTRSSIVSDSGVSEVEDKKAVGPLVMAEEEQTNNNQLEI